jgi:hypothetical protein
MMRVMLYEAAQIMLDAFGEMVLAGILASIDTLTCSIDTPHPRS